MTHDSTFTITCLAEARHFLELRHSRTQQEASRSADRGNGDNFHGNADLNEPKHSTLQTQGFSVLGSILGYPNLGKLPYAAWLGATVHRGNPQALKA